MLKRFDSLAHQLGRVIRRALTSSIWVSIFHGPLHWAPLAPHGPRLHCDWAQFVNLASAFEFAARGGRRVLVDNKTYQAVQDIVEEHEGPLSSKSPRQESPSSGSTRAST